jgi:RNA polymerase sigma-70 factor (ECF subfamily)
MISSTDSYTASPARIPADRFIRTPVSTAESVYDADLVRRFNNGDESAFIEIMARHRERIASIAFAMLNNYADAEEITQDTFMRAHRGLAQFRGDSSLATWLHRIAMNLSRNRYWYFFRRRRHMTLSLENTFGADNRSTLSDLVASDSADPARETATAEFNSLVAACMKRLASEPRKILTLRNTLDRSYGEIARELGVNIGTVKSRIARARKNLRQLLSENCPDLGYQDSPTSWFETFRQSSSSEITPA